MNDFEFRLGGLQELGERLDAAGDKARAAIKKEMYFFALEVLQASKAVCPVESGMLVNTGQVGRHTPPGVTPMEMAYDTDDGQGVAIDIGYGDASIGYALYVHEALEGPHPVNLNWSWAKAAAKGKAINWTRPGSGPKFLENPLKERQDQLPGRVMDAVRSALGV
jgi:hypothetical protein